MSFSVNCSNGYFNFVFVSGTPLYFNASNTNFQIQSNTNNVYVEDPLGGVTVNYTNCTSPTGTSPSDWINNVKALLPSPGGVVTIGPGTDHIGSVNVDNFPATQPVSGSVSVSNFPATQPVSGPLTDTQLRATPVPISGTVTVGTTAGLTNTQLRATPVPISGTVTATGPLTDAELRATPVLVDVNSGGGPIYVDINSCPNLRTGTYYPVTSSGAADHLVFFSSASNNAQGITAGDTRLVSVQIFNNATASRFVKLYDNNGIPDPATDFPHSVYGVPAGGRAEWTLEGGVGFGTGLAMAITAGADAYDNTPVAANDVMGCLYYV